MNNSNYNDRTDRSGVTSYRSSGYTSSGRREEGLLQETDLELNELIKSATDRDCDSITISKSLLIKGALLALGINLFF